MVTLQREWVSVEQARQWVNTYDSTGMSAQMVDAMAMEMKVGRTLRWHHAIMGYTQHSYRNGR
jgi:hypothetical protein